MQKIYYPSKYSIALLKMYREIDVFNKTGSVHFSAPLCKWTTPVWKMALVCAAQARWVWDWSLDPCYLGEFSGLIIKLLLIFLLICGIIILICMYLPGLLSQAHILAVSEPDQRLQLELGYISLSYCSPLCFCQRDVGG